MEEIRMLEETLESFFVDSNRVMGEIDYRMDQIALESLFNPEITLESATEGKFATVIQWFEKAKKMIVDTWNKIIFAIETHLKKNAEFVKANEASLKEKSKKLGADFKYKGSVYTDHDVPETKYNDIKNETILRINALQLVKNESEENIQKKISEITEKNKNLEARKVEDIATTFSIEKGKNVSETRSNYFKKYIGEAKVCNGFQNHSCDEMINTVKSYSDDIKTLKGMISSTEKAIDAIKAALSKIKTDNKELDGKKKRLINSYGERIITEAKSTIETDKTKLEMYKTFMLKRNNNFLAVLRKLNSHKVKGDSTTDDNTGNWDDSHAAVDSSLFNDLF